jgi:hypothetical protein
MIIDSAKYRETNQIRTRKKTMPSTFGGRLFSNPQPSTLSQCTLESATCSYFEMQANKQASTHECRTTANEKGR